ncbi:hypothetical protein IQ06DRAFT_334004 [Phaeosphaeriaceae sp. SRC1lsM3a]|nr:hypothetical protein IQ06DRAFT_334004 [Stagonospora sp. SRC1lsM3a]
MLPKLPLGLPCQSLKDVFEPGSDSSIVENDIPSALPSEDSHDPTSDTALQSSNDAHSELIPDFQPHCIPPLEDFSRQSAISRTDYTPQNALIYTLPPPIYSTSPLSALDENEGNSFQHDEWHAFSTTTPTIPLAYTDANHERLPMSPEPNPPRTPPQATSSQSNPPRFRTYRPEDVTNDDPPPPYYALEHRRAHRLSRTTAGRQHRRHGMVLCDERPTLIPRAGQVPHGGVTTTMKSIGVSLINCFAGVGKMARDVQQHIRVKRAKEKIAWLERYNFMSAQDRLLTQDLRWDAGAGRW